MTLNGILGGTFEVDVNGICTIVQGRSALLHPAGIV
jgi:hypothetical protein